MNKLKKPRILVWQYTVLKLGEKLFAMLGLMLGLCWLFLLGLANGIRLVNDGQAVLIADHVTQAQGINSVDKILRESIGGLLGLLVLTLLTVLARKIVMSNIRNSLTRETTLTRLVTSTGKSIELRLLKVNSPWRKQTKIYTQVKHAPIWNPDFDSKLDRQTREERQRAWIDQENQEREQCLTALKSNELMVAPIEIATLFGTLNLSPYAVLQGQAAQLTDTCGYCAGREL